MSSLIFLICLSASAVGGICGIGGGVIIKPVIDAMGIMSVSAISLLSGLTVLSMSVVNVIKQRQSGLVELKRGSLLAAGSVVGGLLGNNLFHMLKSLLGQDDMVGMIQAVVLAAVTLLTLVYSVWLRERVTSLHVENPAAIAAIGLVMGLLSAFLGIGGGPINLAILYYAFSMDTKKAAANSLYIIMCSQAASFLTSCAQGTIPGFEVRYLVLMVCAGILGGMIGSRVNKKISAKTTDKLFAGLLVVIVLICCYNAWRFAP